MIKPAVLLVHSGGFTSRQWRKLVELLSPDHNVLAPNLLGYGESGPWPNGKPFHYEQDLAHLESLLTEPAHLVGHSYGGFLAVKLALKRPELVRSLALYEPVSFSILDPVEDADARSVLEQVKRTWDPDESGVDEAWLAGFVDWWNGSGSWLRLPEETRAAFRTMGWKVYQEVITLATDDTPPETYATISVPALFLGGEHSPLPERRVVEKLGATLPRGTAQIFTGMGHMGPISHAPLVNATIAAHLQASA